ncbi:MAG: aminotransferase class V-fold PLP-dependent enzyme [candidate division Zixibacteria bacterium]|nr:aminotransferase class V-fold PLP-dependent enzyme [candidate division Zixibacteria bacterium]
MKPIYLDYNATTPIDPRVAEAMLPYIREHFGNPSSNHFYGRATKDAVGNSRKQVADMLHCKPEEIVFTSGGSESNNLAIKGVAYAYQKKGNHIITSSIEHPAVSEVCRFLETRGFDVTYVPVDEHGLVDLKQLEESITPKTTLITIMHANNEVGTIEPITEIAEIAHRNGILIHTDCAQSIGKVPVYVDELRVDLLSLAGHKLYAPKGIGALYIRSGVKLEKQIHGAGHEMGWRAGTENVIEIAGLGKACALVTEESERTHLQTGNLRDKLQNGLREAFPDIRINGHPEKRLPNTASISFPNIAANEIIDKLKNIATSAGAACHSGGVTISPTLKAMNVPPEYAKGTIRFSTGRFTTEREIDEALEEIVAVVKELA